MKPPFRLTVSDISHDTLIAAEELLTDVRDGKIIGFAFVAMTKKRQFVTAIAGEAHRNPTFTRGMVAALDDDLRDMMHR